MNRLNTTDRASVIACLVEDTSLRATVRITGIAKKTVSRLAVEIGEACERFADRAMVNLPCVDIQCDEIGAFVGCKQKNVKTTDKEMDFPLAPDPPADRADKRAKMRELKSFVARRAHHKIPILLRKYARDIYNGKTH